jgi:chorismate mutase
MSETGCEKSLTHPAVSITLAQTNYRLCLNIPLSPSPLLAIIFTASIRTPLATLKRRRSSTHPQREANGLAFYVLSPGGETMPMRGIRGATVICKDEPEEIFAATRLLLRAIIAANPALRQEDIASIFFTVTEDLQSAYPAKAARELGWKEVPMMCAREIPVPGGLPMCIRVLIHWNTSLAQAEVQHAYLGAAASLRPDWMVSREESEK